ncbi:vWA domain-containing protein [Fontivita pretiosa]|uniref:vWA domain-containing protein n=1 Tax=Fontivita pretiosa TaxID=2989684 RepID=UPI003D182894
MSWLPRFLNIWPAVVAAAVAIPALLVLYFLKLKRRELPVSSTLLWKKAIQDLQVNAPFQRLRKNLLLLLQLLLLILLLLALARPITFFTPGAGKNTVILIDRSASMQAADVDGRTRLDEAKRRAKAVVESMSRGGNAMVIAFDDRAEAVQRWTSDTVALKNAIDSIKPTDRKSRLKQAYQLAEAQVNFNPEQLRANVEPPDVFLFSDGRVLDESELSIKGNVIYEQVGTEQAGNIAIVSLSARRNYERPTEVQVFARFANYGPEPVNADVELWVSPIDPANPSTDSFQNRGAAVVKLVPERWDEQKRTEMENQGVVAKDSVEFTLELTTAAVIRVEQKLKAGDMLPADDAAQVVLPPPKMLSVLLVSDGNYYLERAIHSLNLKDPAIVAPGQYEAKIPTDYDVIIFDRYSPKQLPPSGNFLYFGSLGPDLKLKPVTENNVPVMLSEVGVLDWNRDHPILRHLSLNRLYAAEAIKLDVPVESEVLIEGTKGPLVVLHREGRSMHLVVAFDVMQSNWPLRVSFPMFLYNSLQFMALGAEMNVRQSLEPGATPRIPRANLQRVDANLKTIRLNGPGVSRELGIPDSGDFALPPLDHVGVYRLDPIIPQFERIAVNLLDENESNLLPVSGRAPGNIGQAIASTGGKSRLELWWWLVAFGAIPLLLLEWWVYTRRVHL